MNGSIRPEGAVDPGIEKDYGSGNDHDCGTSKEFFLVFQEPEILKTYNMSQKVGQYHKKDVHRDNPVAAWDRIHI